MGTPTRLAGVGVFVLVGLLLFAVGLWYAPRERGGWTVWLRFGRPIDRPQLTNVESMVRTLSRAPAVTRATLSWGGNDWSAGVDRTSPPTGRSVRR